MKVYSADEVGLIKGVCPRVERYSICNEGVEIDLTDGEIKRKYGSVSRQNEIMQLCWQFGSESKPEFQKVTLFVAIDGMGLSFVFRSSTEPKVV